MSISENRTSDEYIREGVCKTEDISKVLDDISYENKKYEENKESFRKMSREIILRNLRMRKDIQDTCSHTLNSTGVGHSYLHQGSFCGIVLNTGEIVGICLYCQKKISSFAPEDAEYFKYLSKWFTGTLAATGRVKDIDLWDTKYSTRGKDITHEINPNNSKLYEIPLEDLKKFLEIYKETFSIR
jgi:hypothetical protein